MEEGVVVGFGGGGGFVPQCLMLVNTQSDEHRRGFRSLSSKPLPLNRRRVVELVRGVRWRRGAVRCGAEGSLMRSPHECMLSRIPTV